MAVALVETVVDKCATRNVAEDCLDFRCSPATQKIDARNFNWPSKPEAADTADLAHFPRIS